MSPLGTARHRGLLAGAAAVGLAGVTAVALTGAGGGAAAAGAARPRKLVTTAKIVRQDLVASKTVKGSLGYAKGPVVRARVAGTVTALPGEGATISRGQPAFRVDGNPVVLLYGSLPAYRAMSIGTRGEDVLQLEANLRALGYTGFTVDATFTIGTARAVKKWQQALGLSKTGVVAPAAIVFASGPLRVGAHKAEVGDEVGPGTPVYDGSGSERVVSIDLDVADQSLVRRGLPVTVSLPGGRTTTGRIADVGKVANTSSSGGGKTTVTVTVRLDRPAQAGSWDQAPVQVSFESSRRDGVLTVAVNALLALAEGGYGVEVVQGSRTRIVAVKPGMFADGRVEVSGAGLTAGLAVEVPAT